MRIKSLSELVGLPVEDIHEQKILGYIRDAVVDPENGKIVAFRIGKNRVVASVDIVGIQDGFFVQNINAIAAPQEILRLVTIEKIGIQFLAAAVYTEKGTLLGRVHDLLFNLDTFTLDKLDVAKGFLWWKREERLIPWNAIVRVEKGKIIVRDATEAGMQKKEKEKKPGFIAEPA